MSYVTLKGSKFASSDDKYYALFDTSHSSILCAASWLQDSKSLTIDKLYWDEDDSVAEEALALVTFVTSLVSTYPKAFPLNAAGRTAVGLTHLFDYCNIHNIDFSHLSVVAEASFDANTKVNRARFTGIQLTSKAAGLLQFAESKKVTITLAG